MFKTSHTHTIPEMMNSENFRNVRLQMLAGEEPKICHRCFDEERNGVRSKRQFENQNYSDYTIDDAKSNTQEDGSLKEVSFHVLDLRMGNTCNVKCRTCNPWSSSKWVQEWKDYGKFFNADLTDFAWVEEIDFWKDLFQRTPELKKIYISGGEPTLIEEHYDYLSALIYTGRASEISLTYNLNMTAIPQRLVKIWKHFQHVFVSASIDDTGRRNSYIRHPTNWDDVKHSIEVLQTNEIPFDITQTISWMNFPYLDDFYEWVKTLNPREEIMINHNFVYDPKYFSPLVLPKDYRQEVIGGFTHMPFEKIRTLHTMFNDQPDNKPLQDEAIYVTMQMDKYRKESFKDVFPELYRVWRQYDSGYFS